MNNIALPLNAYGGGVCPWLHACTRMGLNIGVTSNLHVKTLDKNDVNRPYENKS